jgi:hypothetical protein
MQAQKDEQMAKFLNARYAPHVEQERQATAVSVYIWLGYIYTKYRYICRWVFGKHIYIYILYVYNIYG